MNHSNRHDRARTGPVFYVPESFHPETILPQHLLVHTQSAYYLLHAIMVRIAYGERDGARLKKRYLENVMGRWACQPILECLRESGEIQAQRPVHSGESMFPVLAR